MVNLGNPELAFHTAMLPNDGVGLARMEFIVNEHIGVHPMALVSPDKVASKTARAAIASGTNLTFGALWRGGKLAKTLGSRRYHLFDFIH
jgi:phosphoenolpyruvate synthase/pyruvate phosphate dikinase